MIVVALAFAVLLLMGMPVSFAIGIAGFLFFLQQPALPLTMPVQLVLSETQNFALLAIPMFVFAGNLMNETGITPRLLKFASLLTGRMYGGLAQVCVILATLIGGVTGSAIADASMHSRILGPEMTKRGYARGYAAGVAGFTALITVAIPPSIGLVLYGTIGEVSIGQLFAGGFLPGFLMAGLYMITVAITARVKKYLPVREARPSFREVASSFAGSLWAIGFPFLLLLALRMGLMVPSEAGAAAAVYAVLVGTVIYREMTWERFKEAVRLSVLDMGMIMLLITMSALMSYVMKWEMIPQALSRFLIGFSDDPLAVTSVIMFALLSLGMFIDSTVLILLITAILVPVMRQLGVDLVHFGVVMVLTCAVGLLTPPVGVAMYSVCSIMDCSVGEFMKESWPFLLAMVVVIVLLVLFPGIVTYVPDLLFG